MSLLVLLGHGQFSTANRKKNVKDLNLWCSMSREFAKLKAQRVLWDTLYLIWLLYANATNCESFLPVCPLVILLHKCVLLWLFCTSVSFCDSSSPVCPFVTLPHQCVLCDSAAPVCPFVTLLHQCVLLGLFWTSNADYCDFYVQVYPTKMPAYV